MTFNNIQQGRRVVGQQHRTEALKALNDGVENTLRVSSQPGGDHISLKTKKYTPEYITMTI